ncbi:uncharacterized protein LOC117330496 [Pecten maximus]|uniref:uncharacterized protein LOC117330496 n=1 Tax=Pecten maximus TaxID=6579 RepID=UPI001458AF12|nr:uncharacterized protein LOC117330496 [Pecten maximus]
MARQEYIPALLAQQSVFNKFKTRPAYCFKHKKREVSLFCKTCDRLVCASCIIDGNHGNHKFCEISHVAKEKQVQFRTEMCNRGKEMCEQVQNSITVTEHEKGAVIEMCKSVSEKIDKQKEILIKEIERWSEDLKTVVGDYQTVRFDSLNDRMVDLDTCLSLLKVFQEDPESFDTFDETKSIEILEVLHEGSNPPKRQDVKPMSFLPGSGFCEENLYALFGSLAGMPCETSASDSTENIIPLGNSVCVDQDEADDSHQDSTDTESLYEDADSETMYKCTKSPIDKIALVDVNTAFIVTEKKLYLVDFSKHKGDIEKEKPLMTGVVHITPVTDRGIYVQQEYNNVVTRVTTTGKKYRFIDCWPDTLRCVGLSYCGQIIICTDCYEGSMQYQYFSEHNEDGIKSKTVSEEVRKRGSGGIIYPQVFDIVMTRSALYILNSRTYIIGMPSEKGSVINVLKHIAYNGAIGRDPAKQFHPRGMCQDKDGRLIVTDYWNHAVHLLNPEGKFSKFLMREEDGLAYPTAVTMDNYRYLWIGQQDGTIHIIKYIP